MKRLCRTTLQAAGLFSFALLLIAFNTSPVPARQTRESTTTTTTAQTQSSARITSPSPARIAYSVTVTVTDRKRNYVKGLVQSDFTLSDGKQELQINSFDAGDLPLSVGILVDASGSVQAKRLKLMRDGLQRFFQLSNESNEYFLIGFNNGSKLLQDWTSDAGEILKQIDAMQPNSNTALYDACSLGVAKVMAGRQRKRVLLLLSDGQDNDSRRSTFTDLKRLLEESDVLLYSISLPVEGDPGSSLALEGQAILKELSTTTGGNAVFPDDSKKAGAIFDMLAIELRNQYLIGFAPTSIDGKRHNLKVRVAPPPAALRDIQGLTVRSRKSFYARLSQP